MDVLLKYVIEFAAAAVAAVVAIKVAVARMDERVQSLRNELADLEREHGKIENKIDRLTEATQQIHLQLTRLATLMEKDRNSNGSR